MKRNRWDSDSDEEDDPSRSKNHEKPKEAKHGKILKSSSHSGSTAANKDAESTMQLCKSNNNISGIGSFNGGIDDCDVDIGGNAGGNAGGGGNSGGSGTGDRDHECRKTFETVKSGDEMMNRSGKSNDDGGREEENGDEQPPPPLPLPRQPEPREGEEGGGGSGGGGGGGETTHSQEQQTSGHNPMFVGCRGVHHYERVRKIDEGTYGVVSLARDRKTRELYALKQVKMTAAAGAKDGFPITALRETNILLALAHPNVVGMKEMVVGSDTSKVYMVMEYFDYDLKKVLDLQKKRNRAERVAMLGEFTSREDERAFEREPVFTIREVKSLLGQLLAAVAHMHQCWYVHRDLKTSNILYNRRGKLAVCDFGLARRVGEPVRPYTTNVVTLYYRCPELLLGARTYDGAAVDMWSVGCIFAEMLTGRYFFEGESEIDQLTKIVGTIGVPSEANWPGYDSLPSAKTFSWRSLPHTFPAAAAGECGTGTVRAGKSRNRKLREKFPRETSSAAFTDANRQKHLNDTGFDLLEGLLLMNPKGRLSAAMTRTHPWFAEEPTALPMSQMPSFPAPSP